MGIGGAGTCGGAVIVAKGFGTRQNWEHGGVLQADMVVIDCTKGSGAR